MSQSNPQPAIPQPAPPLLLCESLGFSPQLLLDDIINVANNAVQDGVNGMEEFLQKWADERVAKGESSQADIEATTQEVEQGLVAFQTLLEHHTDIAFDFFEAWCLRNIFIIPRDLPVVLPHQENLNLTVTPEKEQALMDEVEELRKRLDGQRKLNRTLNRAIRTSSRQLNMSQARLSHLTSLSSSSIDTLESLPAKFLSMYNSLSSLPPLDIPPFFETSGESGKRQWETTKTGYMNWALGRLMVKGSVGDGDGRGAVDKIDQSAADIGTTEAMKKALAAVGDVERDLDAVDHRRADEEEDSAMEED